jgi:hypothetical protein
MNSFFNIKSAQDIFILLLIIHYLSICIIKNPNRDYSVRNKIQLQNRSKYPDIYVQTTVGTILVQHFFKKDHMHIEV